jgi:4-hydroxy-tetrahydrodipicolinate synthase
MKMKRPNDFTGIITALVTPFKDGKVDTKSLKKLVGLQLEDGVQGFVVNGTTAESPTLTDKEVKSIFDLVRGEAAGQVPIIVGTGSNNTAKTADFSKEVSKWKADAVLVVAPYYNKPPQRGMIEHYRMVAKASSIPVILYNVPSRTVATLEPETVSELSKSDNIIGIKEATGDMNAFEQIRARSRKNFILLSGDDGTFVDFCERGGHGVISVSSHLIAKDMRAFLDRAVAHDKKADAEFKAKYKEFMRLLYVEANPIPVKMALYMTGVIASPEMRLPLVPMHEKFHKEFKACLKSLKLI